LAGIAKIAINGKIAKIAKIENRLFATNSRESARIFKTKI